MRFIWIFILFSTSLFGQEMMMSYMSTSTAPTYNDYIAHYDFNGDANDNISPASNGTVNGATLVTGKESLANTAYSFDGVNDYIEIPHVSKFNFNTNNEYSYAIWVKKVGSDAGFVIYKGSNTSNRTFLLGDNAVGWSARAFDNCNGDIYSEVNGSATTGWDHVVLTVSLSEVKLFVNGVLANQASGVNTGDCTANINLGRYGGGSLYSDCIIDDFKIWNRPLTITEINDLYEIEKPPIVTDGLVLHLDAGNASSYPGSGTTWFDLSGNNNDGTLVNGVGYSTGDGGSLTFDGSNDYVQLPNLTLNYPFTIDFIVKNEGLISFSNPSVNDKSIGLGTVESGGVFTNRIFYYNGTYTEQTISASSNTIYHITGVFKSDGFDLYVNGVYQTTLSGTKLKIWTDSNTSYNLNRLNRSPFAIVYYGPNNTYITRIYNRTLTASEILQNFNATKDRFFPYPDNYVHCAFPTVVNDVTSTTGAVWMDRNLGAEQVATSSTDALAYGDLFQWGRFAEGHQCRSSATTSTNATTSEPLLGNVWDGLFILEGSSPFDWLVPQDGNLWQGVNGVNNPCPEGYRIPTESEWQAEDNEFTPNNSSGAFNSPLKLPAAGYRSSSSGALGNVGVRGYYRSSSVSGSDARALLFLSSDSYVDNRARGHGFSVRCIKEYSFSPSDISNLLVWLDGQDVDGNFDGSVGDPSDASDVTTWVDKSGNLNNALTNSSASSPHMDIDGLNSYPALSFDGSHNDSEADHFYFANLDHAASDYTFFAVFKGLQADDIYGQYLFDMSGSSRFIIALIDNDGNFEDAIGYYTNSNGWNRYDNADLNPHVFTWLLSSSNVDIKKDGTSMISQSGSDAYTQTAWDDNTYQIRLGKQASSAANASSIYGWLGEILIYDRALSASEIANVENYLQNKWGL